MKYDEQLPKCYVRIDVTHVIKIFCRNKNLVGIKNKQFYIRGIRLLITSSKIYEFKDILIALLTTVMSETNGTDEYINITPSESCKNNILNLIKGIAFDEINFDETEQQFDNNYMINRYR